MDIDTLITCRTRRRSLGYLPALTLGSTTNIIVTSGTDIYLIFPLQPISQHISVFLCRTLNIPPIMNFDSLKEQVTNLSLYDIKAGVRKVQNGKPLRPPRGLRRRRTDCFSRSCYELYRDGGESEGGYE